MHDAADMKMTLNTVTNFWMIDSCLRATSFPGYSHEEYPGTGAGFLGRILKLI